MPRQTSDECISHLIFSFFVRQLLSLRVILIARQLLSLRVILIADHFIFFYNTQDYFILTRYFLVVENSFVPTKSETRIDILVK